MSRCNEQILGRESVESRSNNILRISCLVCNSRDMFLKNKLPFFANFFKSQDGVFRGLLTTSCTSWQDLPDLVNPVGFPKLFKFLALPKFGSTGMVRNTRSIGSCIT
jgi:hypothetical protein